jgi:CheY-like chemotaxis protein
MVSTAQNLHSPIPTPEKISILLVSPHQPDQTALRQILHHADWEIARVSGCQEAIRSLQSTCSSVVLCERDLPDGTWKDILDFAAQLPHPPLVLVTSRHADEGLWAEVLNLGGYDVLLKPFDRSEVTRVIGMAWRHWFGTWTRTVVGQPSVTAQYA